MADIQKENTEATGNVFKYKNQLVSELVSIHALNPYVAYNAPARGVMFSGHFAQRLVISGSEPRDTMTGVEYEMGKYAFSVDMPDDGIIEAVIPLYTKTLGPDSIKFNPETTIIYRRLSDGVYGVVTVPYHASFSPSFGFQYDQSDSLSKIRPGETVIQKNHVFAKSPAVMDDGCYTYGINANVAYMSVSPVSLDGYLINRDVIKKYGAKIIETRTVMFGANTIPVNTYGNDEVFKFLPDIGEETREDGLLFATRRLDTLFSPVTMSRKDLQEVDYEFDRREYGRPMKGRVIGLTVIGSDNVNYQLHPEMTQQLYKYWNAYKRYFQNLLDFESKTLRTLRSRDKMAEMPMTEELQHLLVKARAITNQPNRNNPQPLTYINRREPLDAWRVTITVEYDFIPARGAKFTCTHGGKGVACKFEDPENMPRDADGNVADFVSGPDSVLGRMNLGRLYEPFFNAATRDIRKEMLEIMGIDRKFNGEMLLEEIKEIPPHLFKAAFQRLELYLKITSPVRYEQVTNYTPEERFIEMFFIINNKLRNLFPIDNQVNYDEAVLEVNKHFNLVYGPVTYRGPSGKMVTTSENVRIAPLYMMELDKIADNYLAVAMGKLSNFGILTGTPQQDRYEVPWRRTPSKNVGETEGRLLASYCGRHMTAEMMDRNSSIPSMFELADTLLFADDPSDIETAVDRTRCPIGKSRPLQIIQHRMQCAGFKLVWKPENIRDYSKMEQK